MHWDEPVAIDFESKGSVFFMVSEEKKTRYTPRYIGYNTMSLKYIGRYNELVNLCVATSFLTSKNAVR